ncbi:MAG: FimB/Mfa2 family fimbrial subunit [Muribaculaceae bacterium]|nr:FimB/Mfa2 family fimbrial subunit [Muribaculaceae bacterium]
MMKLKHILLAAVAAMGFTSCGLINDESDCVESANIFEFSYTKNLKFADAFRAEVKSVTLLGFDKSGTLVYAQRARQSEMGPEGNQMAVNLAPGEYDFLVWAGDYDDHFDIASAKIGESKLTDFTCRLLTDDSHPDSPSAPETHGHSAKPLEHLFHALVSLNLTYASPSNPNIHKIDLTKDTNSIRVMLQQQSAQSELTADDFIFEITDRNAHLNHDNSMHSDKTKGHVMYHPWHLAEGSTEYETDSRADATGRINVVLAELTTSRLHPSNNTILTVRKRDTGKLLFSIPLQKYSLMIRNQAFASMSDEEYLDRQDNFSLTFILDENQQWTSVKINVLDWRVIYNNTDLH